MALITGKAMKAAIAVVVAIPISGIEVAAAQDDHEPSAILEVGGAGEWGLKGGSSYGPSLAVEMTPIENWLELEGGVSAMFSRGQTEWNTDFLFKKPFTLSKTVEFMFGVGPEWQHTVTAGKFADTLAGEVALDFMFWPWEGRKYGLYLEPSYDYGFSPGHEQSFSVSAGLLIPMP